MSEQRLDDEERAKRVGIAPLDEMTELALNDLWCRRPRSMWQMRSRIRFLIEEAKIEGRREGRISVGNYDHV